MIRDWIDFKGIYGGVEGARAKFEQACESLLRKKYPNEYVQVVRANPGDEGIDVLVGNIGISPIKVYQCKFFLDQIENAQKAQIRESFNTAINSSEYEVSDWVLFIPKTLDITENKWWVNWVNRQNTKNGDIKVTLINGDETIELMKKYGIYNSYFQIETTTMIEEIHKVVTNEKTYEEYIPIKKFSQDLKDWFKVLNYGFEKTLSDESSSFEWIINVPARRSYDRIYVMGVCEEASLQHIHHIKKIISEQKCDEGWIISTRRISQAAIAIAEGIKKENVYCYTFDELIDSDADFSGYLNWLEEQIKEKHINEKYIPLACFKDEFDRNTRVKIGRSNYNKENGGIEGYIDRWLDDSSKKHISILGEFGTGKTWFSLHYTWRLIQTYKEAKIRGISRPRLPLFIPLRDYAKAISIESLFSEFFFRKHEIPIPGYSAFEQLNKMGKLLLIFDGFDEMADRIDRQKMVNNFWELARVVTGNSKVMLTCRNEHFPEAQESRSILNAELKASVSNLTGESPQFEVLELQRLDDGQIHQLLSFYTTEETVDKIMKNQELLDLARRPVMTELIVEALPEIEAGKPIDMSRIYLYAVTRKMRRDVKEQRTFTSMADKLYFMCELSWEMFSTDNMSLNYKLFPKKIRTLFSEIVEEQTDLDHWHYDMMGQTMLIRDENGDYTPAHRSLLEFFTAFKLAAELGVLALDFIEIAKEQSYINSKLPAQSYTWATYFTYSKKDDLKAPLRFFKREKIDNLISSFGEIVLTKSLQDLLINMISIASSKTQTFFTNLINWCRGRKWKEIGFLATNSVIILLKYQNDFFKGKDLSNLCLYGLSLEGQENYNDGLYHSKLIDLSGTNFQNSDLRFSDLSKSILTGSNLRTCWGIKFCERVKFVVA